MVVEHGYSACGEDAKKDGSAGSGRMIGAPRYVQLLLESMTDARLIVHTFLNIQGRTCIEQPVSTPGTGPTHIRRKIKHSRP